MAAFKVLEAAAVNAAGAKPRAGTMALPHGTLRTPGALLYTRRGQAVGMTPDTVAKLAGHAAGVQVDAMQL